MSDAVQGKSSGSSHRKHSRSRQRTSTSCSECRRRKQKCNQAKDRPCNNCARRYPPVACTYESLRIQEISIKLPDKEPKVEENEVPDELAVETFNPYGAAHLLLDIPLHGMYQAQNLCRAESVPRLIHTPSPYSEASNFEIPLVDGYESQPGSDDEEDMSHVSARSPYFPYPEDCQTSLFGIMTSYVGTSPVESLHSLPVEATRRNAELMHMFVERLSPYMSSIDGQSPVARFNEEWMPFMIQSPIVAYIGILTSSYFQAIAKGIDVEKSVDAIATRVRLIKLINEHLTNHRKGVNDEAIAAVMALAYNELIYADSKSVLAHMKGLRGMLRTRGGLQNVSLNTLQKMLFRTDYQVASTLECEPFLEDAFESHYIPIFVMYPFELDSPLLQSRLRFIDSASDLKIGVETATILDDMRFLTTSVISMTKDELSSTQEKGKFLATATWIHKRLAVPSHPDLAGDFVYQSVRSAAIVYSAAILSHTPLSQACSTANLRHLWANMWRVSLSRWKQTPGIFYWIVLCVTPFAKDKQEGRFLKGMFAAATIAIGLVDWDVVMGMLRGFLAVQRWLRSSLKPLEGTETRLDPFKNPQRRKSTSAI